MSQKQNDFPSPPFTDPFDRTLNYLRIAVTDRCNLRCTYCMPAEGVPFLEHKQIMRFEEILRVVRLLLASGLKKVRITGGEPLVRKGVISFLQELRQLSPQLKIHLTTNGMLLADHLPDLETLHLNGINLSLDTLNPVKFEKITRRDGFHKVWQGLRQALESQIPLKLNMVVQRGLNEDEIVPMAKLARDHSIEVRFIEQMPFDGLSRRVENPLTGREILEILQQAFHSLQFEDSFNSTAQLFTVPGFKGKLGIIAGYSRTFCASCNRLRLTSTGLLKTCLYDVGRLNLCDLIRAGASDRELLAAIRQAISNRHRDGFEAENENLLKSKLSMAQIGG